MAIKREFAIYFVVGCSQFVLDALLLYCLLLAGVGVDVGNVCSRAIAAIMGYLVNGKVNFNAMTSRQVHLASLARFILLWLVMTFASTLLMRYSVQLLGADSPAMYVVAVKIAIEALLFLIAFSISKFWVYR